MCAVTVVGVKETDLLNVIIMQIQRDEVSTHYPRSQSLEKSSSIR